MKKAIIHIINSHSNQFWKKFPPKDLRELSAECNDEEQEFLEKLEEQNVQYIINEVLSQVIVDINDKEIDTVEGIKEYLEANVKEVEVVE